MLWSFAASPFLRTPGSADGSLLFLASRLPFPAIHAFDYCLRPAGTDSDRWPSSFFFAFFPRRSTLARGSLSRGIPPDSSLIFRSGPMLSLGPKRQLLFLFFLSLRCLGMLPLGLVVFTNFNQNGSSSKSSGDDSLNHALCFFLIFPLATALTATFFRRWGSNRGTTPIEN